MSWILSWSVVSLQSCMIWAKDGRERFEVESAGDWQSEKIQNIIRVLLVVINARMVSILKDLSMFHFLSEVDFGEERHGRVKWHKIAKLLLMIKGVQNHSEKVIKAEGNAKWMQLQLWLIFTILFFESLISYEKEEAGYLNMW